MLASRLPSILPDMTDTEMLECTRIHSVAGLHPSEAGILSGRPFRAPHHSISVAGLIGGANLRPGEVSLAHNGVLFLDEFPEFPRSVREALRAPLEDRQLTLSRVDGQVAMPSRFMLIAAANPCPCGFWGHPTRPCTCSVNLRERYRERLSGPLIDRIDLSIDLQPVPPHALLQQQSAEPSQSIRERVS
jgi:magnesium chelatase family protein